MRYRAIVFKMTTLSQRLDAITGQITELNNEVTTMDENVVRSLVTVRHTVDILSSQVKEILGQKRQLDQLLGRWATHIEDPELKADIMRYIFGDIKCEENFDEKSYESPEPPLQRTRTCPPAPKKVRLSTVPECE